MFLEQSRPFQTHIETFADKADGHEASFNRLRAEGGFVQSRRALGSWGTQTREGGWHCGHFQSRGPASGVGRRGEPEGGPRMGGWPEKGAAGAWGDLLQSPAMVLSG